jgi:hypothetical protein
MFFAAAESPILRALLSSLIVSIAPFASAQAQDNSIGLRAGLLGAGAEYAHRFGENLAFRVAINGADYSFDATESDIRYAFTADFDSISMGIDFYPASGPFRLSVGALQNDNRLLAIGSLTQSVTIGDTTYAAEDIGTLTGEVGFDHSALAVGIGWEWLQERKVGLSMDLGLLDQGAGIVSLRADGPIIGDPMFEDDIATEERELQEDFDDLDVYPFLMLGIVVRF